jgi:hypothetical protein
MKNVTKPIEINSNYKKFLWLLLVILGLVYTISMSAEPALGDSLSFTIQAYKGFVIDSNATNHFLYSNILALLHFIFPFLNPHFLFTGFSIFCSILFLFYLNKFLLLNKISDKSAFICVSILGFSFTFWRQSIITEVYTFYLLFVINFLISVWKYIQDHKTLDFYKISILFGVLFLIHIQSILFIPLYFYILFKNFKTLRANLIYGILIVLLIFSILLIPVFFGHHDFLAIFTDDAYQSSLYDFKIQVLLKSFVKNLGFLFYNFLFFLFFLYYGFKKLLFWDYILIGILPFLAFILKHEVSDVYVFQLVPYIFILIILGSGLDRIKFRYFWAVLIIPTFYFFTYKLLENSDFGKKISTERNFKGGLRFMFFPALKGNPDLNYYKKIYFKDSLYKRPELKAMYPDVIEWENIKKQY